MRRWKEAGLKVAAWTVDEPARARALRAEGVDYLITNRPGVMRQALAESAVHPEPVEGGLDSARPERNGG
jgi:glycerophosphoryl diester phosphodiesterase